MRMEPEPECFQLNIEFHAQLGSGTRTQAIPLDACNVRCGKTCPNIDVNHRVLLRLLSATSFADVSHPEAGGQHYSALGAVESDTAKP